jgi:chromatin modification-related protein YNG2
VIYGSGLSRRDETPETDDQIYCFCRQPSFGGMVACDSKDCPYEWFHYKCVGLSDTPKGVWYCPDCRLRLSKSKLYMSTTADDDDESSSG